MLRWVPAEAKVSRKHVARVTQGKRAGAAQLPHLTQSCRINGQHHQDRVLMTLRNAYKVKGILSSRLKLSLVNRILTLPDRLRVEKCQSRRSWNQANQTFDLF